MSNNSQTNIPLPTKYQSSSDLIMENKFTLSNTLNYVLIKMIDTFMDGKNVFKRITRDLYVIRLSLYAIIALVVVYMVLNIYQILANMFGKPCKRDTPTSTTNTPQPKTVERFDHLEQVSQLDPQEPVESFYPHEPTGANGDIIEKYSAYEEPTDAVNTYDTDTLFENLNALNATLYVADNCKYCSHQAEILGETKDTLKTKINLVNCVQDGVFQESCKNVDLQGFPTWECGGHMYTGSQTADDLNNIVAQNSIG